MTLQRLAWGYLGAQSLLMLMVRVGDGQAAYLEGAIARGWTVVLLLQIFPAALAMARTSKVFDPGVIALAEAHGHPEETIIARARHAPLRWLLRRIAPAALALGLWPALLMLGAPTGHLGRRWLVALLLALVSTTAAAALAGLGMAAGRWLQGRGSWGFSLFLWGPWALAALLDLPAETSLPGFYRTLIGLVLGLAPS